MKHLRLVFVACQLCAMGAAVLADEPSEVERATYAAEPTQQAKLGDRKNAAPRELPASKTKAIPLRPRGMGRGADTAESKQTRPVTLTSSLWTGLAALGVVLGLFFVAAWALRRGMPAAPGRLPSEVVEVLGRTPLAARQYAHLIRCGNKLLLVHLAPGTAETLTEITDPAEVDRIAGLCRQSHPQSATATFRHVFQQFAREKPEA
jgi:flagellar protein FliO/FliZ